MTRSEVLIISFSDNGILADRHTPVRPNHVPRPTMEVCQQRRPGCHSPVRPARKPMYFAPVRLSSVKPGARLPTGASACATLKRSSAATSDDGALVYWNSQALEYKLVTSRAKRKRLRRDADRGSSRMPLHDFACVPRESG